MILTLGAWARGEGRVQTLSGVCRERLPGSIVWAVPWSRGGHMSYNTSQTLGLPALEFGGGSKDSLREVLSS